jgi:hypothetical protein
MATKNQDLLKAQRMAARGESAKDIREATGVSKAVAQRVVDRRGPSAAANSNNIPAANIPVSYNVQPGGGVDDSKSGMSQEQYGDYLYESGITTLQGNIQQELEKLRATGLSSVANIQAGATVRSAELDNEARKYLADKDYLGRTDVAKIQAENNLRLQDIINAGLKDVEGIRQQGGRDIATITGGFGVKQESERQRGQKDIAKIGSEAAYRNALIGAFNF